MNILNSAIVIAGPTGVGKTKISIDLAKELNAEIISSDSAQVYKGLNIGTAKITDERACFCRITRASSEHASMAASVLRFGMRA